MIYIGIDPGSVKTGVAILKTHTKEIVIREYKAHCIAILELEKEVKDFNLFGYTVKFFIEDARLVKPNKYLAEKNSTRKNQGAGYVKALSKDWEAFCEELGLQYELRPPSNTKVTPEYFEKLTGLKTLKTQSHMRDAALMVYGR